MSLRSPFLLLGLLLGSYARAQTVATMNHSVPVDKPVEDAETQLVEQNPYFRVFRLQLAPGTTANINQHGRDAVILSLGEDLAVSARKNPETKTLKNGEARFLSNRGWLRVVNSGNSMEPLLVVELEQHWDAEVNVCSAPSKCSRPIRMGELSIGETTSLFTNGFVTAYRHSLERGGTLSSSYFSAKGKDHLLLIALTDLHVNCDGSDATLRSGQTYATDATGVEVNATDSQSRWVVIRVETLKR